MLICKDCQVIRKLRDEIYDLLPTGGFTAFDLFISLKKYIEILDKRIANSE